MAKVRKQREESGFSSQLAFIFCSVGSLTIEWYQHLSRVFQRHFVQSRDIFINIPRSLSLGWFQDHPGIQLLLTIKDPIQQCWNHKIESLLYLNGFNAIRLLTFWWSVTYKSFSQVARLWWWCFIYCHFLSHIFSCPPWTEQTPQS